MYKSATLTAILFIRILSLQPLGEYANYDLYCITYNNTVYAFYIIDVLLLLLWKLLLLQNVFIFRMVIIMQHSPNRRVYSFFRLLCVCAVVLV